MTRRSRRSRTGVPNAGPRLGSSRRRADRLTPYTLTGRLAWIEPDGQLIVLRVRDTNRRARAFRGRTVTVDISDASISAPDRDADGQRSPADLLPGERVTVRINLPRRLLAVPQTVAARSVVAHDHSE